MTFTNFIEEHKGQEWFKIFRIPFMFFATLELLILWVVTSSTDSKLRFVLEDHGVLFHWKLAIIVGSVGALIGSITRGMPRLCKYHVTSTSQFVNSVAWGLSAFILLDSSEQTALAAGMFAMSITNVVLAVLDEGVGDRRIKTA